MYLDFVGHEGIFEYLCERKAIGTAFGYPNVSFRIHLPVQDHDAKNANPSNLQGGNGSEPWLRRPWNFTSSNDSPTRTSTDASSCRFCYFETHTSTRLRN